jgi:hypothetical protein
MPRTTNKTNSKLYTKSSSVKIPPPVQSHPPPVQSHAPSMSDSIKQGFSFGIGSSIAHNMMNSIFGSKNDETLTLEKNKVSPDKIYEIYNKCLEKNDNNIDCTLILQNTSK